LLPELNLSSSSLDSNAPAKACDIPFRTEMAYLLENVETNGMLIFIVGFALETIPFSVSKLRFLSGLGYAIYIAAIDFDEGVVLSSSAQGLAESAKQLDSKLFVPRRELQDVIWNVDDSVPPVDDGHIAKDFIGSVDSWDCGSMSTSLPKYTGTTHMMTGEMWEPTVQVPGSAPSTPSPLMTPSSSVYSLPVKQVGSNDSYVVPISEVIQNRHARSASAISLECRSDLEYSCADTEDVGHDDDDEDVDEFDFYLVDDSSCASSVTPNRVSDDNLTKVGRSLSRNGSINSNSSSNSLFPRRQAVGMDVSTSTSDLLSLVAGDTGSAAAVKTDTVGIAISPRARPSVTVDLTAAKAVLEAPSTPRAETVSSTATLPGIVESSGSRQPLLDSGDKIQETTPESNADPGSARAVIIKNETCSTAAAPEIEASITVPARQASSKVLQPPPAWEPTDSFSFPIAKLPIKLAVRDNYDLKDFVDLRYVADGSNSNVYVGEMKGFGTVVIKMIKEEYEYKSVPVHEFNVEYGLLARMDHPNVIKILGAGKLPRRFVILEYMGGGTLLELLNKNDRNNVQAKGFTSQLASQLFRKPSFPYINLLSRAREIADGLKYLHLGVHPNASIIHRDIKPDNIGFSADGRLKLFDFGLCTCVKRREFSTETYSMTGNTGSLRYMAPEVADNRPYSEKADVYSFAISVWQMSKDKVPFQGMSRDDFFEQVVYGGLRPKLDKAWPVGFSNLLTACWADDHMERPDFAEIVYVLDELISDFTSKNTGNNIRQGLIRTANTKMAGIPPTDTKKKVSI
jgi:hypothetical protein